MSKRREELFVFLEHDCAWYKELCQRAPEPAVDMNSLPTTASDAPKRPPSAGAAKGGKAGKPAAAAAAPSPVPPDAEGGASSSSRVPTPELAYVSATRVLCPVMFGSPLVVAGAASGGGKGGAAAAKKKK